MSSLVALDPGRKVCGLARFEDGVLVQAEPVRFTTKGGAPLTEAAGLGFKAAGIYQVSSSRVSVEVAVVERPQVYTAGKWKGDPNDLLPLAACAGAFLASLTVGRVVEYLPREWKGQLPDTVTAHRILDRLTAEEHAALPWLPKLLLALKRAESERRPLKDVAGAEHNALDSVGLGLAALGRFTRRVM